MYISAGWRDIELSFSLSLSLSLKINRTCTGYRTYVYNFSMKYLKTLKKYLGSKYVEPALNHEMVRAVLTERQTRDCDVKGRITFHTKGNYCLRMWNSKPWVGPNFYAPEIEDRGAFCFCPVCHSVIL